MISTVLPQEVVQVLDWFSVILVVEAVFLMAIM